MADPPPYFVDDIAELVEIGKELIEDTKSYIQDRDYNEEIQLANEIIKELELTENKVNNYLKELEKDYFMVNTSIEPPNEQVEKDRRLFAVLDDVERDHIVKNSIRYKDGGGASVRTLERYCIDALWEFRKMLKEVSKSS